MPKKKQTALKPIQTGQIWEVGDVCLSIGQVGKTLVHYKRYKGKARGVPSSLAAKTELEKYLKENKAVLTQE
jgi:hypothetical protein